MKIQNLPIGFIFLTLIFSSHSIAAGKLTAEQVQIQKDQVKYQKYIPAKYALFQHIQGDLNKDGKPDLVLIVKGTDPKKWVNDEYRGKLDRNRRGMIILLSDHGQYKKVVQNLSCFSSENEDGGVYYPPELDVSIAKGTLKVSYAHGRYGHWNYSFKIQGNDLRLIGYDNVDQHGPYIQSESSVNFLTGKKVIRKNLNVNLEENPKFQENWQKVDLTPIYLSKIKDFDTLLY